MILNFLHTLSGLLIIFFFIGKIVLHYYLDVQHKRTAGILFSLLSSSIYFQRYKSPVTEKFVLFKRLCNGFLQLSLIALLVNMLVGIIIYVK